MLFISNILTTLQINITTFSLGWPWKKKQSNPSGKLYLSIRTDVAKFYLAKMMKIFHKILKTTTRDYYCH